MPGRHHILQDAGVRPAAITSCASLAPIWTTDRAGKRLMPWPVRPHNLSTNMYS